jgi:hypothetical protein
MAIQHYNRWRLLAIVLFIVVTVAILVALGAMHHAFNISHYVQLLGLSPNSVWHV